MLMLLVSRTFGKVGDMQLGAWSCNLTNWPSQLSTNDLGNAIAALVPRAACLEITAETLNTRRWRPRKDFEADRLVASQLQLASGTAVVFDETKMTEGQLSDAGVKSLMAIAALAR